ncbi:MAG: hypothetical protein WDN00_14365 [Limisphaerales bacterium]
MKKLRIGFMSAAGIGKKNWKAIFNSGNCVVSAVASRDMQKSREYVVSARIKMPLIFCPKRSALMKN